MGLDASKCCFVVSGQRQIQDLTNGGCMVPGLQVKQPATMWTKNCSPLTPIHVWVPHILRYCIKEMLVVKLGL